LDVSGQAFATLLFLLAIGFAVGHEYGHAAGSGRSDAPLLDDGGESMSVTYDWDEEFAADAHGLEVAIDLCVNRSLYPGSMFVAPTAGCWRASYSSTPKRQSSSPTL